MMLLCVIYRSGPVCAMDVKGKTEVTGDFHPFLATDRYLHIPQCDRVQCVLDGVYDVIL